MNPEQVSELVTALSKKIVDAESARVAVKQLSCIPKAAAMLAIAYLSNRLQTSEFLYLTEALSKKIVDDKGV